MAIPHITGPSLPAFLWPVGYKWPWYFFYATRRNGERFVNQCPRMLKKRLVGLDLDIEIKCTRTEPNVGWQWKCCSCPKKWPSLCRLCVLPCSVQMWKTCVASLFCTFFCQICLHSSPKVVVSETFCWVDLNKTCGYTYESSVICRLLQWMPLKMCIHPVKTEHGMCL